MPASIMDHRSYRHQRRTKSTLACEACAADTAADHGYFVAWMLSEVLFDEKPSTKRPPPIDLYLCTDCKSLYDALLRLSPNISEKRTQIELGSIRELVSQQGIRWVPSEEMHADPFTKIDRKLEEKMRQYMQNPYVCLREPEDQT